MKVSFDFLYCLANAATLWSASGSPCPVRAQQGCTYQLLSLQFFFIFSFLVSVTLPRDAEQFFLYKIDSGICKCRRLVAVHGLTSSEPIQFWQDLSSSTSETCL
uniref:Secreted protein n=1 Tax=Junco hyemalis TaxID=40217 RepID=A0A8C5IJ71_JUNHY